MRKLLDEKLARFEELERQMNDPDVTFEQVLSDVNKRDYNDMHRAESPLTQAEDAVVVDTTHMDFEQVVDTVTELYKQRRAAAGC